MLYLLKRINAPSYDEMAACVVQAETEGRARVFAAEVAGDEGADCWIDARYTTCKWLSGQDAPQTVNGIICRDFRAG